MTVSVSLSLSLSPSLAEGVGMNHLSGSDTRIDEVVLLTDRCSVGDQ